jgi:chemotaxis protein methyltransferase CheR
MVEHRRTTRAEIAAFLQWALPRLGLRWRGFRNVQSTVEKRLVRRMAELGLGSLGEYRARLESHEPEWELLDAMCRIPISRLYRDRAVFERLTAEVLPSRSDAAMREGRPSVDVWSAGCASGEEPYTVAILWHLEIAPRHPGLELDLLATDVNATMIARGEHGCYGEGSLRELPSGLRETAFDHGDGDSCVKRELRRGVRFRQEDMRKAMPDGPFDLILCRNSAFTYFDEATQRAVAERFAERLRMGGALVVGTHEEVGVLERRAPCIYQRVQA